MRIPNGLHAFARTVTLSRSLTRLFLYDAGSPASPPMVLVHGLGDEADSWRRVIPALAETFRVIAPDLPGFGRSPLPVRRYLTPRFLGDLLLELLNFLELPPVIFVGSSLGASLVQVAAVMRPERAARLILVDGGLMVRARLPVGLLLMLLPGVGEKRYRTFRGHPEAAFASLQPYYASLDRMPGSEREFLRQRVEERVASDTQQRAYFSFFRGFVISMLFQGRFLARRARALHVPTRYIWGARDHIIPVAAGRAACELHPGAKLSIISGAGHLPHQETPEEFLRVVDQALAAPP